MPTVTERVSVLETKVENIDDKLDNLKSGVKDMHDCLDLTRDGIMKQLDQMHVDSSKQHQELAGKVGELEKFKHKWTYMVLGGLAVAGWVSGHINVLASKIK
mgnify:FL=1